MKIFQSFSHQDQIRLMCPTATPISIDNIGHIHFREYEVMKKIQSTLDVKDTETWGLLSWKFELKTQVDVSEFTAFANKKFSDGADCVFINPMIGNEAIYSNVWEQAEDVGHCRITEVARSLSSLEAPYLSALMGQNTFSLCNYFIATKSFWFDYFKYVEEGLKKLENACLNSNVLADIYFGSGHYHRDKKISMRPFVIERLFSSFIHYNKQYRCDSYPFELNAYTSKFGSKLGNLLFKLSYLKNMGILKGDDALIDRWSEMRKVVLSDSYKIAIWHLDDPAAYYATRQFEDLMYI